MNSVNLFEQQALAMQCARPLSQQQNAIEYIKRCAGALADLVPLLDAMIETVSDELGMATELEDARCALIEDIAEGVES